MRVKFLGSRAISAIGAQMSQALGSFVLQVLASKFLGLEGLGAFAVLYGLIVIGTAIVSGFVGDSLTVLDRSNGDIRAGLQTWLLLLAGGLGTVAALASAATGYLDARQSALFGAAAAVFMIEDSLRRLLMAVLQFWSIVVVDLVGLLFAAGLVVGVEIATGSATLSTFFGALLLGQVAAIVAAVVLTPRRERWLARGFGVLGPAWRYGRWRSLQLVMRPLTLAAVRLAVTASAGLAVYGQLEAARIYVAPAMLMVNGAGSYLFASYARDKNKSLGELLRKADRGVIIMLVGTVLLGIGALAAMPFFADVITGGEYELQPVAVAGWTLYTAATAAVTPFGSLAAVRGGQVAVLGLRVVESVSSIIAVVLFLVMGGGVAWVPAVLAFFAAIVGVLLRRLLAGRVAAGTSDRVDSAVIVPVPSSSGTQIL